MKKYSWNARYFNGDAQLVGEELEKLEKLGEVNSKEVLDFARKNIDSELHKCFEWDDEIAGEKYRQIQSSQLLCSISYVVEEEQKEKQRVYVSINNKEKERIFKNIEEVLEDDDEYKQILRRAEEKLNNYKLEYEKLLRKKDLKDIVFNIYKKI